MRTLIAASFLLILVACQQQPKPSAPSTDNPEPKAKLDSPQLVPTNPVTNNTPSVNVAPNTSTQVNDKPVSSGAVMHFDEPLTFNFGTVKAGELVKHNFEFTNTGKQPLVISDAKASCGCTVPAWTEFPINPNGGSSISVTFDTAHKSGTQTSSVVITTNANPRTYKVVMQGIVEE